MTLFERRHFERLATLPEALELTDRQRERLALWLEDSNPRFNRSRFLAACDKATQQQATRTLRLVVSNVPTNEPMD